MNGNIGKREAVLTLMTYRLGRKALPSRGEDRSVVTFLESLTNSLEDSSVVTWDEVLKRLMVRMENACHCDAVHFVGWSGRRLLCHAKVGSGICVMSVLFAIFFV